jgi:hypothetical protein
MHSKLDVTAWRRPLLNSLARFYSAAKPADVENRMHKKEAEESSPAPAERAAEAASGPAQTDAHPRPRSHRELGDAIFAVSDPVNVGRELLDKDKSDDRGAPTRLRSLQTFADWAFEKPSAEGQRKPPRIIWDIPGPPYEPVDPLAADLEKLEGGEK